MLYLYLSYENKPRFQVIVEIHFIWEIKRCEK